MIYLSCTELGFRNYLKVQNVFIHSIALYYFPLDKQ